MAHTYHVFYQIVFLVSFLICLAYCAEIKFTISLNQAEDELTMRCSLNDTSLDLTDFQSIIIKTHSGSAVASITAHRPARMGDNIIGFVVTGKLWQQSGEERGFIQAVWKHPVSTMNGMYQCEISGLDRQANLKVLRKEQKVDMNELKLNDVIDSIRAFKLANDQLQLVNLQLKRAIDELTQVNSVHNAKIHELKNRQDTRVIFTAINNADVYVADDNIVVFPRVITNAGFGYDKNTGVFTCPVAGWYAFQVYILGAKDSNVEVSLKKNFKRITSASAQPGYNYQSGANAANVWLNRGDIVTVTTIEDSKLYGDGFCSFSGHLISPA